MNGFDVAPGYGDAQLLMGNSLRPYRKLPAIGLSAGNGVVVAQR